MKRRDTVTMSSCIIKLTGETEHLCVYLYILFRQSQSSMGLPEGTQPSYVNEAHIRYRVYRVFRFNRFLNNLAH